MKEIAKNLKKVFEEGQCITESILEDAIGEVAASVGMSQADFVLKFPGACVKLRQASAGIAAVKTGVAIQMMVKDFNNENFKDLMCELSNEDDVPDELLLCVLAASASNVARLYNDISNKQTGGN